MGKLMKLHARKSVGKKILLKTVADINHPGGHSPKHTVAEKIERFKTKYSHVFQWLRTTPS